MPMLRSIELLWPDYASLVLVLDPNEALALPMAPPTLRTSWVTDPLGARGASYWGQMHSAFWIDRYTSAPLAAILDSDFVLQARTGYSSLTAGDGELVLRYVRCPATLAAATTRGVAAGIELPPPVAPTEPYWDRLEAEQGCLYAGGVEALLGVPYIGNFMVQIPLVVPRAVFGALRAHVERLHGVPFDDAVDAVRRSHSSSFSQHSALGNFLWYFGRGAAFGLNGSAAAGGLRGLRFIVWGREEMFPHVGRHVGWEGSPTFKTRPADYLPAALEVIRDGVCAAYTNVDPALCAAAQPPKPYLFQLLPMGPGHGGPSAYRDAFTATCFTPADR